MASKRNDTGDQRFCAYYFFKRGHHRAEHAKPMDKVANIEYNSISGRHHVHMESETAQTHSNLTKQPIKRPTSSTHSTLLHRICVSLCICCFMIEWPHKWDWKSQDKKKRRRNQFIHTYRRIGARQKKRSWIKIWACICIRNVCSITLSV